MRENTPAAGTISRRVAGRRLVEASVSILKAVSIFVLGFALGGCFIWPLKVAEELDVQIIEERKRVGSLF